MLRPLLSARVAYAAAAVATASLAATAKGRVGQGTAIGRVRLSVLPSVSSLAVGPAEVRPSYFARELDMTIASRRGRKSAASQCGDVPVIESVEPVRHGSILARQRRVSTTTPRVVRALVTRQPVMTVVAGVSRLRPSSHVVSFTCLLRANRVVPRSRVVTLHVAGAGRRRGRQAGDGVAAALLAAVVVGHDVQLVRHVVT